MTVTAGEVDRERLEELLGGPHLAWLRDRVRARLEAGRGPDGTATLRDPGPEQRAGVDRLLGRRPTSGATLTVHLAEVDATLRRAGICDGLADAVVALDGPIERRRAREAAEAAAWEGFLAAAERRLPDRPWAGRWLAELAATGLVRRLADTPEEGRRILGRALDVLDALPAGGVGRERFSAAVLGDSHGLDDDRPVTTLVLKALVHRRGELDEVAAGGPLPTGEERRSLWASAGVLLGELARPVLALNVPARGAGATDRILRACHDVGEPARLTLRQLVRRPPDLAALSGARVHVCENPAVVAAAADALGVDAAPLVCVEGQPATPARTLLAQVRDAGAELVYHGDFDWPGIRIAGRVMTRFDAAPWRFTASDYRAAPPGPALRGERVATPWDPALEDAMADRGVAVHEEQVMGDLLDDVAG